MMETCTEGLRVPTEMPVHLFFHLIKLQFLYYMFFKKKKKSLIYICDKTTSKKRVVHMFGHM